MTAKTAILLAVPNYNGTISVGTANGIRFCTKKYPTMVKMETGSLMDRGMNILWAMALEQRDNGQATHFAQIHSDVEPEAYWLDTLMDVMTARGADIVSAIIPTKCPSGITSTAIDHPTDPWSYERRLTMREVHKLPETFGTEICPGNRLLVNNGLMLVDLRKPWCDEVCWHTENRIVSEVVDGKTRRLVQCVSQDWLFSREAQKRGASIVATRKVPVIHHGQGGYLNNLAWGEWEFDREYATRPLEQAEAVIETMTPGRLRELLTQKPQPAPMG